RIQITWLQVATRGMPFNQCMSVPMQLSLRTTPDGPRLIRWPMKELEQLRKVPGQGFIPRSLKPGDNPLAGACPELFDLEAVIEPGTATQIAFDLRGTKISYDVAAQELV